MLTLIQIVLLAALAGAFVLTLRRGRQSVLSRTETFLWCVLWFGAAIVVVLPEVTTMFAKVLGVGRGVDAVLYVSVVALFYLAFRIFLRLDKLDRDISKLVREVAIREADKRETK